MLFVKQYSHVIDSSELSNFPLNQYLNIYFNNQYFAAAIFCWNLLNMTFFIVKGTMGNGTYINVSGERGHFMLWETGHSTLSENDFFLSESDHLSSGNRDMGNGKRYPLGFGPHIPRETSSGKHSLGIGNLGDEVQPLLMLWRTTAVLPMHL